MICSMSRGFIWLFRFPPPMKIKEMSYVYFVFNTTFSTRAVVPWSWSYGSWIYTNLCNQCLSPLKLWVQNPPRRGILDTTFWDKANKTDRHDITEILLKVAGNTITLTPFQQYFSLTCLDVSEHYTVQKIYRKTRY
jgi:hypothetical protein